MPAALDELERALGYPFRDRELLLRAVTHSSLANELSPNGVTAPANNERLEFLGDAILGWVVSDSLFHRFQSYTEGQLSLLKNHLVSAAHLLETAQKLELGKYLHLGRGEESAGGRSKQRLLVNAFEAVIAAVYIDSGSAAARELILHHIMPNADTLAELAGAGPPHDFRSELERLTRDRKLPRPVYLITGEIGPGHARKFTVEARVGKDLVAVGHGSSKKSASHDAAKLICQMLRDRG
jgi:ribonuclease III